MAGAESTVGSQVAAQRPRRAPLEQVGWLLFATAAALAGALVLWLGRETTYSPDELAWFVHSRDLGLDGALQPHAGHLILTTRLVYKLVFETLGVDYLPFRLLTLATVVTAAALFFAYAGRRVGRIAALAPTLLLLAFGSDVTHMVLGNGFTVIGAIACGLGALLALDREDRAGDAIACGLLCLGVATYTVALAFVAGVGVSVLIRGDRWRRIWIVAIPVALYAAWWLWALGSEASSEGQLVLSDVLLFPSWAFQSLAAVLGSISGLDYDFGSAAAAEAGVVLAVAAIAGLGLRIGRGSVPPMLWAVIAIALTLWLMGSIVRTPLRVPESSRYLYPGAVAVLLVGTWAVAGRRFEGRALWVLFGVAAIGLATNIALLRDGTAFLRGSAEQVRAGLTGLEVADGAADPDFIPGGGSTLALAFMSLADDGEQPTAAYLAAVARFGSPGYPPAELPGLSEPARLQADTTLAGALRLALAPIPRGAARGDCVAVGAGPGRRGSFELAPGASVVLAAGAKAAPVQVRRFAAASGVELGTIDAREAAVLSAPADRLAAPWQVTTAASSMLACAR